MTDQHFNWDDLRIILAVARCGSVRRGAAQLTMHHSSVVRRINAFEERHDVKVFERQSSGYVPTTSGEDIVAAGEVIEAEALALERRTMGLDGRVSGKLRVTLPTALASHLLMPQIVAFCRAHKGIELVINATPELSDLTRREADIAIRITASSPPEHLIGRRAGRCAFAYYGYSSGDGHLGWTAEARFHGLGSSRETLPLAMNDVHLHLAASKAGYGQALLPRFIGDAEPDLLFLGPEETGKAVDIWVLTHSDLARTARVRAFTEFAFQALRSHQSVLDPESYQVQND
ncbi:MAG: LysR family transcriptional regulator [Pseudomonadota bacterium]|nr:LysR family transcriptional regulator [Pseudomonadota bacterium]